MYLLTEEVLTHKTSINPPLFSGVPVKSQESEWLCMYVLNVSILPLFQGLGTVLISDSVIFCAFCFVLYIQLYF